MNDWISVKTELPDYEERVLIAYGGGMCRIGYRDRTTKDGEMWKQLYVGEEDITTVTHWQPLPDLPKEYDNTDPA